MDDQDPIEIPIDGVLDLHTFHPRDVKNLVPDYIDACLEQGIYQVRIIHGKGTGLLRKKVHKFLQSSPLVHSFSLASPEAGSWGATIVFLKQ